METYIYVSVPDTFLYKVIKHDNIKESASEICESMKRTVVELRGEKCLGIVGSTKISSKKNKNHCILISVTGHRSQTFTGVHFLTGPANNILKRILMKVCDLYI